MNKEACGVTAEEEKPYVCSCGVNYKEVQAYARC